MSKMNEGLAVRGTEGREAVSRPDVPQRLV